MIKHIKINDYLRELLVVAPEKVKPLNRFRNFKSDFHLKIYQLFIFVQTHKNEQKSNFNDIGRLGKIA